MKRLAAAAVVLVALLAAHVVYWYVPRERAVAPRLGPGPRAAAAQHGIGGQPARDAAGGAGGTSGEPLRVLAAGAYDVCLWVPYPHQNLGALAGAIGDLQDVAGAVARLTSGQDAEGSAPRTREPEEPPTFGPFEVPPASEMVACSDLAGGRLKVVARIYPALAVVAKLAGSIAGNPWLAGGVAGPTRIAWEGRLWTVTAGPELPPAAAPSGSGPAGGKETAAGASPGLPLAAAPSGNGPAGAQQAAAGASPPELPESLAVVHWTGVRPEIPAGYYALTRSGSDLALSLVPAGGGGAAGSSTSLPGGVGPLPSLLVAVGPDWHGAGPFGGGPAGGGPASGGAALALFETGGSRLSSLGDLPGLAVFNAAAAGAAGTASAPRWRLPTEGLFRLLAGRLPATEVAGWRILALDQGSLRQAETLAPRLAALMPPVPASPAATVSGGASAAPAGVASPGVASPGAGSAPAAAPPELTSAPAAAAPGLTSTPRGAELSLGLWLEPRSTLRIVTRIRRFVEKFPLASRRQVDLWRDWETVLDPLANCDHAALTATASPPSMRLLLRGCTASGPR
ncbi:MAG: hypothetical protein JOZ15_09625 [Acidobacteria bacterium]|nr:hypothetical protein [Acidobacteriota bacterium]